MPQVKTKIGQTEEKVPLCCEETQKKVRANIEVHFVIKEPVRKPPPRPIHMSDIEIPGPG